MRCKFGHHDVDPLDSITQWKSGAGTEGATFVYCTSHEPLTSAQVGRLKRWVGGTPVSA